MRKYLLVLLMLLLALPSAACVTKQATAHDIYSKAAVAMGNATSLAVKTDMGMYITEYGTSTEVVMTGSVKVNKKSKTDVEVLTEVVVNIYGQNVSVTTYYKDGTSYVGAGTQKYRVEVPLEDFLQQTNTEPFSFPDTAVLDQQVMEKDGGKELSFTLDGSALSDAIIKQVGSFTELVGEEAAFSIGDVKYVVLVDGQGYLKTTDMNFDMQARIEDETRGFTMRIGIEYEQINDVVIDFPDDLDSYKPLYEQN
jgi:hypothetical protein